MGFDQDILVSCRECATKYTLAEMKHDDSGENLICKECYKKLYGGKNNESRLIQSAESKRINYKCFNCGYAFSRSESFNFGGICVNCGKTSVQREDTKTIFIKNKKQLLDY
ncbi:hypothetical protein HZB00_00350 [Candidatus Woesearchaeota archaeon]|nr:hypothetical protein [Candidatus Woesearchaeota archaeon]